MGAPLEVDLGILGWSDSLLLMVLALVVFGPRRLPQIGRQIGKLMYEFRKASNDFKFQMEEELRAAEEADRRKKEEERLRQLSLKAPEAETPAAPAENASAGSPYREDVVYPPGAPAAEPQTNEPVPVILPPSTGEPVQAGSPARNGAEIKAEIKGEADFAGRNGTSPHQESEPAAAAEGEGALQDNPQNHGEGSQITEQATRHG